MKKTTQVILEMAENGTLREMIRAGLISWKVARDKDIFLTFDTKVKTGKKRSVAINETISEFDLDAMLVRRAIKMFE